MSGTRTRSRRTSDTDPTLNASKVTALIDAGERSSAVLYRTATAGPCGQRAHIAVGTVRFMPEGPWEFRVLNPATGEPCGYARREIADGQWWWSMTVDTYDGFMWAGYAETLSLGCDVIVHGEHAATGRHDSRRTSPARWRSAESVHQQRAREHVAACEPCRAAGEHRGYFYCVTD